MTINASNFNALLAFLFFVPVWVFHGIQPPIPRNPAMLSERDDAILSLILYSRVSGQVCFLLFPHHALLTTHHRTPDQLLQGDNFKICGQHRKQMVQLVAPVPRKFRLEGRKVMKHDDIPGAQTAQNLGRQILQVAVAAIPGPATEIDGIQPFPLQHRIKAGAGNPIGWAKHKGLNPLLRQYLLGLVDILLQGVHLPQHEKIIMAQGVIADGVPLLEDGRDQSGIFFSLPPHHKKCGG